MTPILIKDWIRKGLLTFSIVFNLFAFSGIANPGQARASGIVRTEWVASVNASVNATVRRNLTFKKIQAHFTNPGFSADFSNPETFRASRRYDGLVKAREDHMTRLGFSIKPTRLSVRTKTISQNADEDRLI